MTEPDTPRRRPPHRRPSETQRVAMPVPGVATPFTAHVTVGFEPSSGRPVEVFARATGRTTTFIDYELDDVAVLVSLALQHGASPETLARSMGRAVDPATGEAGPTSFAGHLVEHLARVRPLTPFDPDAVQQAVRDCVAAGKAARQREA